MICNLFAVSCQQDDNEFTYYKSMVFSVQNCLLYWSYCSQVVGRLLCAMWLYMRPFGRTSKTLYSLSESHTWIKFVWRLVVKNSGSHMHIMMSSKAINNRNEKKNNSIFMHCIVFTYMPDVMLRSLHLIVFTYASCTCYVEINELCSHMPDVIFRSLHGVHICQMLRLDQWLVFAYAISFV